MTTASDKTKGAIPGVDSKHFWPGGVRVIDQFLIYDDRAVASVQQSLPRRCSGLQPGKLGSHVIKLPGMPYARKWMATESWQPRNWPVFEKRRKYGIPFL
jgi:hypothetical protein